MKKDHLNQNPYIVSACINHVGAMIKSARTLKKEKKTYHCQIDFPALETASIMLLIKFKDLYVFPLSKENNSRKYFFPQVENTQTPKTHHFSI